MKISTGHVQLQIQSLHRMLLFSSTNRKRQAVPVAQTRMYHVELLRIGGDHHYVANKTREMLK